MDLNEIIPSRFNDGAKVWIYQSSRLFGLAEAFEIEVLLDNFIADWKSHGKQVNGYGNLFYGHFLVFIADQTEVQVSGCSTDSMVHFIKSVEEKFKVNFFDHQLLAFHINEKVQFLPMSQLKHAFANNFIQPETLYFNNQVDTKKALIEAWPSPLRSTWLAKRLDLF